MADIVGTIGDDNLAGTSGSDRIDALGGNDILDGRGGADQLIGGTGNDIYVIDDAGDAIVESAGEGVDQAYTSVSYALGVGVSIEVLSVNDYAATSAINLTGNEFGQQLIGNAGANTLSGGGGTDALYGLGGNDILIGGTGADAMTGGTGNDTYIVDDAGDTIVEANGEGVDQAYTSVSYALGAGASIEVLSVDDYAATSAINLTGNEFGQQLIGNAGANVLSGGGGADALYGLGGDDILIGGTGADAMTGGTGNDIYIVDDAGDTIVEANGEGVDQAYTSVSYALGVGVSIEGLSVDDYAATIAINLTGNEFGQQLIGNAGANTLSGGGGNDALYGLGGNDILIGGTGADAMTGGTGNDIYIVDDAGDTIAEANGEGVDQAYTSVSYALGAGVSIEGLSVDDYAATSALNLTGNEFGQQLIGNAGANTLSGGGGNDALYGLGGNDILIGGTGADAMTGGTGNDIYIVDNTGDTIAEANGEGVDQAYTSVNYALGAGVSIEVLSVDDYAATSAINLTGNEFGQQLIGNAGANTLNGGGGNDTLIGGDGDDTYIVDSGDTVIETAGAGAGVDTVLATSNFTLGSGQAVEILSLFDPVSQAAINLTGNDLANTIRGNQGANTLNGGGGNDTIYGGLGADTLIGGDGADTYVFDTALGNGNVDTIDFDVAFDSIQLAGGAGEPFAALASGVLSNGSFRSDNVAADADDYILYDRNTGALYFDDDGNGAHAAVQFATLPLNLPLSAFHFFVTGPANHVPVITSGGTATVPENSPPSTIVYQAAATDSDGDRITYSLSGPDGGRLTIDPVSGAVRLNSSADFETKSSYDFFVVASDSGDKSTKEVVLTVTDVAETITTPIIDETAAANNNRSSAQLIDRTILNVGTNSDLPDQTLPSATIHGSISTNDPNTTNNDIDFYSIFLQAGEQIVLDVDHTTTLDSFIRLYDTNGAELVSNDDKISGDTGSVNHPGIDHNTDSYLTYRVAESGTYYFSIESFGDLDNDQEDDGPNVGESSGNYSLNVSIGPRASAAQIMDEDINALISGAQWDHNALTYGFPTLPSQYPGSFKEVTPASDFSPFTAAQQGAAVQLLQLIANVSSLTFAPLSSSPGNADIRYAMSTEADPAYAYYPTNGGPSSVGGTAWFDNSDFNDPVRGNYAWMGILHETGHTLGLKHGHEAPAVSADHDSVEYTVMTYRSYTGGPITGYTNEQWGYPQSLMMLDIAALQRMYGANFSTNSGNSVYSWSPTTGEMSINGVGQGAPGSGIGASSNRIFLTTWDGGGNDTYDLSNYTSSVSIDLRPGEWSTFSSTQLASLGGGHFARGNVANALMYQGNTDSLIENAIGGSGGDNFIGNQIANHFTGNGGADTFRWMAATDVGTGALADTIMDFTRGSDKIDLSNIDANSTTTTVQDLFHFIGTAAFSHTAGELRYDVTGGNAHIFADLDGNGVADMEIVVNGVTTLAGTDFNGATGNAASVPADLAAAAATDRAVIDNAAVPAGADASVVTGRVFGDFGGLADAPVHMAAMHDHASLAGMDFYF